MSHVPNLNRNKHNKLTAVCLSRVSNYFLVDTIEAPLNKHIRLSEYLKCDNFCKLTNCLLIY